MEKKKESISLFKKIKWINNKKLLFLSIVFILIFLLSDSRLNNVKADSNYSNYLTSESISVKNDRALILLENSGSSNNFRNYYETSFLFPSKLRDEMYSIDLTTNPAKYYIHQAYLSDLDNEYAFSDVENLGQYETNSFIQNYTDINELNGYFNEYNSEIESQGLSTILNENGVWVIVPYTSLHIAIRPNINTIMVQGSIDQNKQAHCFMDNLNDYEIDYTVNSITVNIYGNRYDQSGYISDDTKVQVLTSNYTSPNTVLPMTLRTLGTYTKTFTNLNQYGKTLDFVSLKITSPTVIGGDSTSGSYLVISTAWLIFNISINDNFVLKENDYNSYNYITNGSGIEGLFSAEYTFTNDANDSNPTDWICTEPAGTSIKIISDLDGHDKIVELYDNSANDYELENIFDSTKTSETIEFWWRSSQNDKSSIVNIEEISDITDSIQFQFYSNGYFTYYDTVMHNIQTYNINQWYHIEIDFDISDNGFYVWIDGVQYGKYNFRGNPTYFSRIKFWSYTSQNFYSYIDAVDYSWSNGYYENRNRYDSSYSLNITSNLQLERLGNSFDNLEKLELEYTFKSNSTSDLKLYLRNINSNNYDLIDSKVLTTTFQEFSYIFDLNYTYYSTLGLIEFMFYIESSNNHLISIDKVNLKTIFSNFSLNNNGYHNIELKFNRKTSGGTNRGNISFNVRLYKNHFYYDYIENNVIENDYEKLNQLVNFTETEIKEVEIQAHIRYGLNTLDIDICNMYYLVIINYNYTFELFEQMRFGNNDGNYFRSEFSYDSMNFNRLNNTGIFGNYSSNYLSGLRVLRGDTSINYNRYFLIPYFDEKISLNYNPAGISHVGSEPKLPSSYYWEYESVRLAQHIDIIITVENWSVDYTTVKAEIYTAKHPYYPKVVNRKDLGNWKFSITDSFKVDINFIRNAVCDIINLILLFFQWIYFFVMSSISYILMYIGINIMVLIWNTIFYYLFVAMIWILWYLWLGIYTLGMLLWNLFVYVYETYLIPFFVWLRDVFLPIFLEALIVFLAFGITSLIYILTLGQIDFYMVYAYVYDMLWLITTEILAFMNVFINNLYYIFLFMLLYIYNLFILYFTFLYCRSRGYKKKAEKVYYTLMFYLTPVLLIYDSLKKLLDLSPA